MPSASVKTATSAKAAFLRSIRKPQRTSCQSDSIKVRLSMRWISSRMSVRLPNFRRAAYRAFSGVMPLAMFSSVSISRYVCSSRSRSCPQRSRWKNRIQRIALLLDGSQHTVNCAHQLIPAAGLLRQLPSACCRQTVVTSFAIVFRSAPERSDPPAALQTVQRRIERAMLDLQDRIGAMFDHVRDGVTVRRAQDERLKDQQVQRALQQIRLQRRCASFCHVAELILP